MTEAAAPLSADIVTLWEFVRGDLSTKDFAERCYLSQTLGALLGQDGHLELISTDFRDVVAVDSLRTRLEGVLRALASHTCDCLAVANCGVVDMGEHRGVFASLEEVARRGPDFWWLWASRCRECGQGWLVGSEERQNDVFCMLRLAPETLADIARNGTWPPDFDRYEALLQLGRRAGRSVRFIDPLGSSSLRATIGDLARARPGIPLTELASLLNLDLESARRIALSVAEEESLSIGMDE
ncbi:MAG: hypothetical protein IPI67_06320 [Myxococcales bacterium]|nr:hypothetical protein [Myxococcales bacterium]